MVHAIYANNILRRSNGKIEPSHCIAMNTTVHNGSGMKWNYYKRVGLLIHDWAPLKGVERRHERNQWMKQICSIEMALKCDAQAVVSHSNV